MGKLFKLVSALILLSDMMKFLDSYQVRDTTSMVELIHGKETNENHRAKTSSYDLSEVKGTQKNRKFLDDFLHDIPTPGTGPYFDKSVSANVTGLVGKTAYLRCRVKNIGNRTVSWIRHRDIHLLTVGRYTYTSDQRFEAIHSPHTEDWSLRIKYPQRKDSGIYECQISTTPPIGHQIHLKVVEPRSEILGGPELFVDKGSTINLTCLVEFTAEIPTTVQWSHENKPINFDSPRGGISLVTIKGPTTSSRLLIQKASSTDSGEYACDSLVAKPAIIRVHILNGEHPAAMHHGHANIPLCHPIISALIVPFILILQSIN